MENAFVKARNTYERWLAGTLQPETPAEQRVWDLEMLVRKHAGWDGGNPERCFTEDERRYLADEADSAGEGMYDRRELITLTDHDLALCWLDALQSYVDSHF